MTDDQTRPGSDPTASGSDPTASGSELQPDERQLRKVLAMTNDLEPPRDDLFAQRALQRGQARTARRRNLVLGAAAAVVVIGITGGSMAALRGVGGSTTSAGSAASAQKESTQDRSAGSGAPGLAGPSVPSAGDTSPFFGTLSTPATTAFEAIAPELLDRWRDVFAGAYADDATGTRVVVTVTRHDPDLEAYVTAAMPPGSVRFELAPYTWVAKEQVAAQVRADTQIWAADGVRILAVQIDSRSDRVVVTADEGSTPGRVAGRYGAIVRVVAATAEPTLPDGGTLPTLQR